MWPLTAPMLLRPRFVTFSIFFEGKNKSFLIFYQSGEFRSLDSLLSGREDCQPDSLQWRLEPNIGQPATLRSISGCSQDTSEGGCDEDSSFGPDSTKCQVSPQGRDWTTNITLENSQTKLCIQRLDFGHICALKVSLWEIHLSPNC